MNAPTPASTPWFLLDGTTPLGPFGFAYIAARLESGTLAPDTRACPVGGTEWKSLRDWKVFAIHAPVVASVADSPYASPRAHASPPPVPAPGQFVELPDMAKAICIYAMYVSPVLWLLGNASCITSGTFYHEDSPLFGFEVLLMLGSFLVSTATTVLLLIGGLQLQKLRATGAKMLFAGYGIDIVWFLLAFLAYAILGVISSTEPGVHESAPRTPNLFDGVLAMLQLVAAVLEVAALSWLLVNHRRLPVKD